VTGQRELDAAVHEQIKAHCAAGDKLAEARAFEGAIAEYNKAWSLVPDPANDWEASTWILAAIADAAFLGGYLTSAREALQYAMTCPGAIGNPFLHLRFGQVLFDSGEAMPLPTNWSAPTWGRARRFSRLKIASTSIS